jgi:hypothetical protein
MHKLAATSVLLMLVAVLVLLDLLVALTCGYLVSNNAIRGPGGNHGVHSACVSYSHSCAITIVEPFELLAIMVYFLLENYLKYELIVSNPSNHSEDNHHLTSLLTLVVASSVNLP